MLIFLYEFVTGGGWFTVDPWNPPRGSLRDEGHAMLRAVACDFAKVTGVEVIHLRDTRHASLELRRATEIPVSSAGEEHEQFCRWAAHADWTMVVAPEFSNYLAARVSWAEHAGARLLSPGSEFVAIAADKQTTAERLARAGVPMPRGCGWHDGAQLPDWLPLPWVIKPRDGAGSVDVRLIATIGSFEPPAKRPRTWRIEEFCPGLAASVSVLCGPAGPVVLPSARQILSDDGRFQYHGGVVPLSAELCQRTNRLAKAVVAAFPPTVGYIGIDLVLGAPHDGSRDFVVEVNPRLTTSYIGLRRILSGNLAEAMMRVADGAAVELSFESEPVTFAATSER